MIFRIRSVLGFGASRAMTRGATSYWSGGSGNASGALTDAMYESFYIALDMCGNEGQASIIESMGIDAFRGATVEAFEGGDAVDSLMGYASHPEAVEQILEEAGSYINDVVGDALSDHGDEGESEGEEGEEEGDY